ncbi:MAG: site-specific integrase, partial [Gemmatimonadota bacterium]|nr:site-specific integrase [Gemmatimonadota bacterium]
AKALPRHTAPPNHYRALPYNEVADAIARIRKSNAHPGTVLCFEFMVLCASRSGEARNAQWEDIRLSNALWTIPAADMKKPRRHRIPLSTQAIRVLLEAQECFGNTGYVFKGAKKTPISESILSKLLRESRINAVPHGFRGSFRDFASERTWARREVIELSLAHVVGNPVVQAYARSDHLEQRRKLTEEWAAYLYRDDQQ